MSTQATDASLLAALVPILGELLGAMAEEFLSQQP